MNHWHRVFKRDNGREYLYNLTFVEGWYGGATHLGPGEHPPGYNDPHPETGIPYWRTPAPVNGKFEPGFTYAHWAKKPARKSASPREAIIKSFTPKSEEITKQTLKEYKQKLIEVVGQYNQAKSRYL